MTQTNIPDHCWRPNYKNDSRKWLISNESTLLTNASSMKDQFRPPSSYNSDRDCTAKRRELIRNKIIAEISEEIAREKATKSEETDYCTTYDEKFRIPGFRVKDKLVENTKLHLKYPLYKSNPITIWSQKLQSTIREVTPLEGTTKIGDPLNPFKRNDSFSTPISQRLDEPEI